MPLQKISPEQRKEIVEKYLAGAPARLIGEQYGVSIHTVLRILRQYGEEPRRRGRSNVSLPKHLAEMSKSVRKINKEVKER